MQLFSLLHEVITNIPDRDKIELFRTSLKNIYKIARLYIFITFPLKLYYFNQDSNFITLHD